MSENTKPEVAGREMQENSTDQAARETQNEARRVRVERLDELAVSQSEADIEKTKADTALVKARTEELLILNKQLNDGDGVEKAE